MTRSIGRLGALLAGAVFVLGGCASWPAPTAKMASTAAAIRAAEELQAADIPAAQLRLQYAKDQFTEGKKLVDMGENERADRMFQRAEADAELAVAIARQVEAEKAAIAAQLEVQKVSSK
jgi:biopolymer transport protein ExbB/TolQ